MISQVELKKNIDTENRLVVDRGRGEGELSCVKVVKSY